MAKEIESEESSKPVLDEQTLAKLLEAAYVLQEHNRELQAMELSLELKREQIEAEDRSHEDRTRDARSRARGGDRSVEDPSIEDRSAANFPAGARRKPQAHEEEDSEKAVADYTFTLAKIVETQHQIQVRHLDLDSTMTLVADRLVQIAHAGGAAIGVLDDKKFRYRAASGTMTLPVGTEIPFDKALCVACVRTGQVFRCVDVNPEFLLDTEECRRRGILSLIAVPVFHEGQVAGGIELYYPTTHAFTEHDVHTCQLMAGLVTEALAREEEHTWKKSLATERAVMLDALEKLRPNLTALVDQAAVKDPAAKATAAKTPPDVVCKCGHTLVGEEQFCGSCGAPRSSDYEPPSMQSKVASLWHMQEALKKADPLDTEENQAAGKGVPESRATVPSPRPVRDSEKLEKSLADSLEEEMPELFSPAGAFPRDPEPAPDNSPISAEFEDSVLSDLELPLPSSAEPAAKTQNKAGEGDEENEIAEATEEQPSTALARTQGGGAWKSAAGTREFLEQLAGGKPSSPLLLFWNTRRGDIYLAVAVILVLAVIRWGIWSNHSVSATGNSTAAHHKAPQDDLSMFDRMLISLGLAEAPPPGVESKGNPETRVWVDLRTGLYYCPADDLYGKTPNKGKYTTQRDAQLDSFQAAYHKNCE